MIEGKLTGSGYSVVRRDDRTEVTYDMVPHGSKTIIVFHDRLRVDNKTYTKALIRKIYPKIPEFIAREAGHVAPRRLNFFAALGATVGAAVKQSQIDRANREEWSVWFDYIGGESCCLASNFDRERADKLTALFSRLVF